MSLSTVFLNGLPFVNFFFKAAKAESIEEHQLLNQQNLHLCGSHVSGECAWCPKSWAIVAKLGKALASPYWVEQGGQRATVPLPESARGLLRLVTLTGSCLLADGGVRRPWGPFLALGFSSLDAGERAEAYPGCSARSRQVTQHWALPAPP